VSLSAENEPRQQKDFLIDSQNAEANGYDQVASPSWIKRRVIFPMPRVDQAAFAACVLVLVAGIGIVLQNSRNSNQDVTVLQSSDGDSIFGGRSIFAREPRPRRAARRGRHQAGFFSEDHSIFTRGRTVKLSKKKKPRTVDAVAERTAETHRSVGGNYTVQPSGFLEGIVDEVEQVRRLPKTAQEQLKESEASVVAAKQQLQVADELRRQAADDTERLTSLEPHVEPLEEVALARDARARWFDRRAEEAEKEAKEDQEEIDKLSDEDEQAKVVSLKQQLLMKMVNKVVHKVEQAHHSAGKKRA
jgi:hypothetical protein